MTLYQVQNQWGGSSAPWNEGGKWVIGARSNQNIVAMDVKSDDGGQTLNGTITYQGEGPIGFRATRLGSNNYTVENQWGGSSAPWNPGGTWVIGYRANQNVVAINVQSNDGGQTLNGSMTYKGEGPIGFKGTKAEGGAYTVENQWGGSSAPWNVGGVWALGCRNNQNVVAIDIKSNDGGKTFTGTMTYSGEGPIGFKATLLGSNNYNVENQWGGSSAPWNPGGLWIIGYRENQNVVALNVNSNDGGKTLNGTMTYDGEGPIGFKGSLN
ncbi:lectin ESA-2 [Pelatocladus sp. BLCC-F211]|uniref:lectin OAA family protein n=1 Tax=Pelatocladus sp. BLCC-F211 TaxID=3342752 RepID=UPI0035BAF55B